MARFVGTAVARTLGSTVDPSFTKADVFTTPGSYSWNVPSSATKIKVYVVGAGSDYNLMTHCYASSDCNSGVASLGCNYCLTFNGHAMGAGGGYAERIIDRPSGTATVVVGARGASVGCAPTDSAFCLGGTNIVAFSARHVSATWCCVGNCTARDCSNFAPISLGFQIPTCGHINCTSGWWSLPGCATGGNINRVGGCSIIIPEFICDSNIRPNTVQCPVPASAVTCGMAGSVGTIFFPGTACQRQSLTTAGSLEGPRTPGTYCPVATGGGVAPGTIICCATTRGFDFYYGATGIWCMDARAISGGSSGGISSISGTLSITYDPSFRRYSNKPIGLGASSGLSESNGFNAKPETFTVTPIYDGITTIGSGGGTSLWCVCSRSQISTTFGSSCYCCFFTLNLPCTWCGCSINCNFSLSECCCWLTGKVCNCTFYPELCIPAISGGASGAAFTPQPYYDITYIQTETSLSELTGETIPLAGMVSNTNVGLSDLRVGSGAGSRPATFGGGGNRCFTAANGAVVILYQ